MKIGIQTWGSEGDINPFIALAKALSKAGNEVTLAITSTDRNDYKTISKKHGFTIEQAREVVSEMQMRRLDKDLNDKAET